MSAIAKAAGFNATSLATTLPSHNHMIGPFGDQPGIRGGLNSGAGEDIKAGDLCYVTASGVVLRALEDQTGTTAAVNDVQTMVANKNQSANITGGTNVYGYRGQYTPPQPITANAATIQAAIQALSTVGAGNIIVGAAFPNFTFTGAGAFAGVPLDLIEIDSSLITDDGTYAVLSIIHTTEGQAVGAAGAEQAASRVRGVAPISVKRGQPITLYDACIFNYSDGNLIPGQDIFLSGTVPGGLDTVRTLAVGVQFPVGFAMDTQRVYFFGIR